MSSRVRIGQVVLAMGAVALLAGAARADCGCSSPCSAPQYITVTCCQMVPVQEQVQVTRYRMEAHQENYTTYRCETVPEQRQVTTTVCVPRWETVQQQVVRCRLVPYQEQRQVTEYQCVPVQQQVT